MHSLLLIHAPMQDLAKAGFLYAVCRKGHLDAVKIGYTCSQDPHAYCHKFNRTYVPVQILQLVPVSNAPLAEKMAHHYLKKTRVSKRNEVFDISNDEARLNKCFQHVEAFDVVNIC